ncbi:MAG: hypothetical protein H6868_07770 [Rhodospirillales bacterium]|nr:hypothetical protein [Rhodospirillales bacterium]
MKIVPVNTIEEVLSHAFDCPAGSLFWKIKTKKIPEISSKSAENKGEDVILALSLL